MSPVMQGASGSGAALPCNAPQSRKCPRCPKQRPSFTLHLAVPYMTRWGQVSAVNHGSHPWQHCFGAFNAGIWQLPFLHFTDTQEDAQFSLQNVFVTGSAPCLGRWSHTAAVPCACKHEGKRLVWETSISAPVTPELKYKYLVLDEEGQVEHTDEQERCLRLPTSLQPGEVVHVQDHWQVSSGGVQRAAVLLSLSIARVQPGVVAGGNISGVAKWDSDTMPPHGGWCSLWQSTMLCRGHTLFAGASRASQPRLADLPLHEHARQPRQM